MYHSNKYRQKGVALVVGLILLLVATLVTVLGMQGSQMQERMSSNQNNKAISFMAAEYGASHFIAQMEENGFSPTSWVSDMNVSTSGTSPIPVPDSFGFYWIQVVDPEDNPIELNVFGVARESQTSNNLALTQLNILLDMQFVPGTGSGGGSGNGGAINFVGDLEVYEAPNSNKFLVNGQGGPAVAAKRGPDRDLIESRIDEAGRLDRYFGGIAQIDFEGIWESPSTIQSFVNAACDSAETRCSNTVPSGTVGNKNSASSYVPKLTVVTGDATINMKGNETGTGILIVTGNLSFTGTPSWNGLVIVLGGSFHFGGGGTGGIDGALYVVNTSTTSDNVSFTSSGGGGGVFNYNCDKITAGTNLLNEEAQSLWGNSDGCDNSGGSGGGSGGSGTVTDDEWIYSISRWAEVLN